MWRNEDVRYYPTDQSNGGSQLGEVEEQPLKRGEMCILVVFHVTFLRSDVCIKCRRQVLVTRLRCPHTEVFQNPERFLRLGVQALRVRLTEQTAAQLRQSAAPIMLRKSANKGYCWNE